MSGNGERWEDLVEVVFYVGVIVRLEDSEE